MTPRARYVIPLLLILCFVEEWERAQAITMLAYCLFIIWTDFGKQEIKRFDISTAYSILLLMTSVSHITALFGWIESLWFFRSSYPPAISGKAIFIFNLGSVLLMESMRVVIKRDHLLKGALIILKKFSFEKVLVISVCTFLVSIYFKGFLQGIGAFGSFFLAMINGTVLLLSFISNYQGKNRLIALTYAIMLSVWYLQYGYLRMEIVIPLIAYLAGDLLAAGSLLRIHFFSKALIVFSLLVFPSLFTFLGSNRSELWGAQKLDMAIDNLDAGADPEGQTIMSRLSIIPQISKIIKLTESKGFYEGQTLNYLGYVFIPRFIWPDKPKIKQGQWFALEIGAAYKRKDGRINNSVNMTVPGEFYLNFGWMGLGLGCILFGLTMGWIWNQTNYENVYGWVIRFYLLFLGLFSLGADLQIIPTVFAYLITYKLLLFFGGMVQR